MIDSFLRTWEKEVDGWVSSVFGTIEVACTEDDSHLLPGWEKKTLKGIPCLVLTFGQCFETVALDSAEVNEHVVAAFALNKTKTFFLVKPFYAASSSHSVSPKYNVVSFGRRTPWKTTDCLGQISKCGRIKAERTYESNKTWQPGCDVAEVNFAAVFLTSELILPYASKSAFFSPAVIRQSRLLVVLLGFNPGTGVGHEVRKGLVLVVLHQVNQPGDGVIERLDSCASVSAASPDSASTVRKAMLSACDRPST